ncbi:MAG: hypothetical protein KGZ25_04410, partial [Planctomycetes bacterium]|nr:hypothetical protein [Planctomycetota bacterium]
MQKLVPLGIITAIILGFAVLTIGTTGCRFNSDSKMPDMPAGGNPPDMALPELKERLFSDHASFQTLTADCKATIVCPLLRSRFQPDRPIDITLPRGRIAIAKTDAKRPAKVYLRLSRAGTKFVELIGNGSEYQVKLPGFKDSYGGSYGDPIGETTN